MKPNDRLKAYHAKLSALRWPQDMFESDRDFWRGSKRPKKALPLLEAHLRRGNGRGSPQECDNLLKDAIT